jgi:hypothetical protein
LIRPGQNMFDWGRFGVVETDTAASLAARLGGWHGALRWLTRSRRPAITRELVSVGTTH